MSSKGKSTRSQFTLDLNKKAEKRYVPISPERSSSYNLHHIEFVYPKMPNIMSGT